VGAFFAKKNNGSGAKPDVVELALDLTAEAIILFERPSGGEWKRFASAHLDDPEFPIVIGLLRNEAEAHVGGHRPVRLWLPGEQVLKKQSRIPGKTPDDRLKAAFDYVDRQTIYRPEDVAVAVAPAEQSGKSTLLITFAETWREARDYAARWGFEPGEVSTRQDTGGFGPEGPVFRLNSQPVAASAPVKRNRLVVAALALAAIAAGTALWALQPWEAQSGLHEMEPAASADIAGAPVTTLPQPLPPPRAPAHDPEARIIVHPPRHSPDTPKLAPPPVRDTEPNGHAALDAPGILASLAMLVPPAAMAAAPSSPLVPEPAPPDRDPVSAWAGPIPALEPPAPSSPPAGGGIYWLTMTPIRVELVNLIATDIGPPHPLPAAPFVEPWVPEPASMMGDAEKLAEVAPGVAAAQLPVSIPVPRPKRPEPDAGNTDPVADPVADTVADTVAGPVKEHPLARILPPPRPAVLNGQKTQSEAPTPAAAPTTPDSDNIGPSIIGPGIIGPDNIGTSAPAKLEEPDPDAPTDFASLKAPMPKPRPKRPTVPRELPSISALPAITGIGPRSIRSAATEQGLPMDRAALIGILNLETGRKALLRLPNGRYRSVIVGDVLDGWRVSLIGVDAMRITRSGEDRTLLLINR
jgi:hypothetical protein